MRVALHGAWILLGVMLCMVWCSCVSSQDRKPIPVIEIEVMAGEDSYRLDNQRMNLEHLKSELLRIADETRRPVTHSCRAYVRLNVRSGAAFERGDDIVTYCNGIGLDQIENRASGN
jgi:hypothetical protein